MFATLHPDSKGLDMIAVEASTKPPIFNRPPHVVCQLCRSKKLRCSGYDPNGCARCRDSATECLPVERSRRESRTNHKSTKARAEALTRSTNNKKHNSGSDNNTSTVNSIDMPDLDMSRDISTSESPKISSVFSPGTPSEGLFGTPSFTSTTPSLGLYIGDALRGKDDIQMDDSLLLPTTGIDLASSESLFQNPEIFKFGASYMDSELPCPKNEMSSSNDLRWQEMFDMMIQGSDSTPSPCQCLDRALEMLDGLFVQHGGSMSPSTATAMQKLSSLRVELNGLEGIATCTQCKGTRRLMSLLVLLAERLSTNFRQICGMIPASTLQAKFDFENSPSPASSNGDLDPVITMGENEMLQQEYNTCTQFETRTEEGYANIILSCNGFSFDMSKETETLLLTLALLAMQQLRKVIATLWARAQEEQRKDLSENLTRCGKKLHGMNAILKEKLTKEYA